MDNKRTLFSDTGINTWPSRVMSEDLEIMSEIYEFNISITHTGYMSYLNFKIKNKKCLIYS